MPIEMKDSDHGLGVVNTSRRVITENEYLDSYKNHLSQDKDKFQKYRYSLNDWSEATDVEVPSNSIAQISELCKKKSATINPYPVVSQAAAKDTTFGLSIMWEILSDETNWDIMVFRDREDAEAWIRQKVKEKYGIGDLTFG